jgi:general secretion pathway protein G
VKSLKQSHNKILNNKGMTLIEIMIVLVIIGGLASILATQIMGRFGKAQANEAKIQIKEVGKQLDMFYTDCGFYPQTIEGLVTADPSCKNWGPDPYMKKLPKDPWGSDFVYEPSGSAYVLKSLGKDRKEGGSGNDADISSDEI